MGARSTLFAKPVGDNPLPSINTEDTCPTSNFSNLFVVQNTRWHGNKISHSHNLSKFFLLAWFERSACPHLHTWNEHLVALQQVAEGEICWLVLGLLPEPVAVALYDQRHENQFVRVIYPRHVDETSVVVDLMDEFGSGFGKHGLSRRGLQTAGTERERRLRPQFDLVLEEHRGEMLLLKPLLVISSSYSPPVFPSAQSLPRFECVHVDMM